MSMVMVMVMAMGDCSGIEEVFCMDGICVVDLGIFMMAMVSNNASN